MVTQITPNPPFYVCPECDRKHYKHSRIYDEHMHHFEGPDGEEILRNSFVVAGLMLRRTEKLVRSDRISKDEHGFLKETREWTRFVLDLEAEQEEAQALGVGPQVATFSFD